jgi:hypothetical protein
MPKQKIPTMRKQLVVLLEMINYDGELQTTTRNVGTAAGSQDVQASGHLGELA